MLSFATIEKIFSDKDVTQLPFPLSEKEGGVGKFLLIGEDPGT